MPDHRKMPTSTETYTASTGAGRGVATMKLRGVRRTPLPFVTISRQAGAGGRTLGEHLVEQLNRNNKGDTPWELFDQQLAESVAKEHDLPREWVELLEDRDFSWLSELFGGLDFRTQGELNEFTVYKRVSETIRRLAHRGNAVIVGRGGAYITADIPEGVHVRLVAPLGHRISHMARRLGVDREQAEAEVERTESNRRAFYQRYWHGKTQGPEEFTMSLNTESLDEQTMVRSVVPLVEARKPATT